MHESLAQAVEHCIVAARRSADANEVPQSHNGAPCETEQSSDQCTLAFEVAVWTRLAKRGHAPTIACSMWAELSSAVSSRGRSSQAATCEREEGLSGNELNEQAMSERRGSHARASTLQGSLTMTPITSRRLQPLAGISPEPAKGGRETAADLGIPLHSLKGEKESAAVAIHRNSSVMLLQRLLCHIADSQALEKILAALLLEAPQDSPQTLAQVG